jgi:hypothetical protein
MDSNISPLGKPIVQDTVNPRSPLRTFHHHNVRKKITAIAAIATHCQPVMAGLDFTMFMN